MQKKTYIVALAIALASLAAGAPAMAATCPSAHGAGSPVTCELPLINGSFDTHDGKDYIAPWVVETGRAKGHGYGDDLHLFAGARIRQDVPLPLNTTLGGGSFPSYTLTFTADGEGAMDVSGSLMARLTLVDDAGGNALELGSTRVTVTGNPNTARLEVAGREYLQPAYLRVQIQREDGSDTEVAIDDVTIVQSF
jgi:hypothetical protein